MYKVCRNKQNTNAIFSESCEVQIPKWLCSAVELYSLYLNEDVQQVNQSLISFLS